MTLDKFTKTIEQVQTHAANSKTPKYIQKQGQM